MQGPTYISSEIVPQKEAEFPAMTVCAETEKYKESQAIYVLCISRPTNMR